MATKRYWTISEVAGQFGVNQSLLRYWEKEFPALDPKKQGSGKRAYTARDIEIVAVLHDLLKEKGYTIDGAKRQLRSALQERQRMEELKNRLEHAREELLSMAKDLDPEG
ncbi:MAG TPA: transcriptional regulator [Flavobacteriales bacterium]|jgi:DNA-binding transcriptional MerR regulator|nr:transcriptional regulator [Flavobacteriales bacterium]